MDYRRKSLFPSIRNVDDQPTNQEFESDKAEKPTLRFFHADEHKTSDKCLVDSQDYGGGLFMDALHALLSLKHDPIADCEEHRKTYHARLRRAVFIISSESEDRHQDRTCCVCKQETGHIATTCCDRCAEWYHFDCAGLTESEAKKIAETTNWTCPHCVDRPSQATLKPKSKDSEDTECDAKAWQCETCSYSTDIKAYLARHRAVHIKQKPFTCDICRRPYKLESNLRKHKETHNIHHSGRVELEGKRPYECHLCSSNYKYQRNLRRHLRTQHST